MQSRVYIFIDGGYFYKGTRKIDTERNIIELCHKIAGTRKFIGATYFVGEIDTHMGKTQEEKMYYSELRVKQQKFLSKIYATGVQYKLGYFNKHEHTEKSVDMLLACDMIEKAMDDLYDVAIVITGDGDFYPAIELIQKKIGKIVLNGAFKGKFSRILLDRCDQFFFIDDKI